MPRQTLTANERAEREYQRMLQTLRNDLKRELNRDTQKLLGELRRELAQEIKRALSQNPEPKLGGGTTPTGNDFSGLGSITRMIGTVLRLSGRPTTSSSTRETTRSYDAFNNFKLSQRQSMADASAELGRGERNS